jgi:TM2 domain-containing membrane protein YozV
MSSLPSPEATPAESNAHARPETLAFQPLAQRPYYSEDPRLRSVALATVLSLMPGLGQVYLGYIQQGFINILVVASLIALLAADAGALTPLLVLFLVFFWLYNIIDANRRTILLNQRVLGLAPGELPEDVAANLRGSVFGGLALILGGIISLAHLRFGLSLAWIQQWWPVAVIGLGIYLVWKAVKSPKE